MMIIVQQALPNQSVTRSDTLYADTLSQLARKEFEIDGIGMLHDTLFVFSSNTYVYYPFGSFNRLEEFAKVYRVFRSKRFRPPSEDPYYAKDVLYDSRYKNSEIRFFNDQGGLPVRGGTLKIVKGKILDEGVTLKKGVAIGLSKENFLKLFLSEVPREVLVKTNVVKLESVSPFVGLDHYYVFRNNKLAEILFETDYDEVIRK